MLPFRLTLVYLEYNTFVHCSFIWHCKWSTNFLSMIYHSKSYKVLHVWQRFIDSTFCPYNTRGTSLLSYDDSGLLLYWRTFVRFLETLLELSRKLFVTCFTDRFQIQVIKLRPTKSRTCFHYFKSMGNAWKMKKYLNISSDPNIELCYSIIPSHGTLF